MKRKDLFLKAINTLFWSFGSEPPAEVIWGSNELLDWYECEYNVKLGIRFDENCENYEEVISIIMNEIN